MVHRLTQPGMIFVLRPTSFWKRASSKLRSPVGYPGRKSYHSAACASDEAKDVQTLLSGDHFGSEVAIHILDGLCIIDLELAAVISNGKESIYFVSRICCVTKPWAEKKTEHIYG